MTVRDLIGGWDADVTIDSPVRVDDLSGRTLFKTYRDSDGSHDDNIMTPCDLDDGGDDILNMTVSRIGAYDGDDDFSGGVLLIVVDD